MSILTELEQYIENSPSQYSSFIRPSKGQLEENFMNRKEPVGASYTEVKFFKKYLHLFFQVLIYGLKIFNTKEFKIYRNLFKQLNRQIDEGVIRHIFTLKILNDYLLIQNKICVIGDGTFIFKEKCKWHDRYYESKFPYIKKHYGEHLHALIKYE